MAKTDFKDIDEYIGTFDGEVHSKLQQMRKIIRKAIPTAQETISYQIPVFKVNGKYVAYFAGFKNHISFYPIPKATGPFKKELGKFAHGKGTLRFSLDKPLPDKLITKVVKTWERQRGGEKK